MTRPMTRPAARVLGAAVSVSLLVPSACTSQTASPSGGTASPETAPPPTRTTIDDSAMVTVVPSGPGSYTLQSTAMSAILAHVRV